ncbi:Mu transposase C-terminal domain-containing protein [Demequina sp.]|uniref:Mu transposase C-terminal domain-containing protein n=1 Tax=Demequina sp. TaxID=2050685 RepID=UPI003D11EFD3
MRTVRLFDYLSYEGDSYQLIAVDGAVLALKSLSTNVIRHVGVSELLGSDSYEPDAPARMPALEDLAVLDRLDDSTRERTEWLEPHIKDIAFGLRDDAALKRPQYADTLTMAERIDTKAVELAQAGNPITARSLRRYATGYKSEGLRAIVDGRKMRQGSIGGFQSPALVSVIEQVVDEQTDDSTGTRSRVITLASYRARQLGLDVPSRATMYRLVADADRGKHTFGDATTRRSLAKRPARTHRRSNPDRPGELVEIDSMKLDLMVLFPDGTTGRPELTSMIDVATRTVCAAVLLPESTKGVDVAALVLIRALTPLPMRPGWSAEMELSRSILPAGMIEPDEELRRHIAARPVIYPDSISIDRGKVFTGKTFQRACERLQISVTAVPPGTPTAKPHVERQFGAVHTGLIQYLSGYVGRNTTRRGVDPSKEAFWTLDQVQSILDQWLVLEWQRRPRKGLVVPGMPKQALSPNEMYAALSTVAPTPAVALTRDDYMSLLPMVARTVQQYGINHENLHYDSPEIHKFRGVRSRQGGQLGDRWEVRYDPARMNAIYFRDPFEERWIEVPWRLAGKTLAPFSAAVLAAAVAAVRQKIGRDSEAMVLEEVLRIQSGIGVTRRERKAARHRSGSSVPELRVVEDDDLDEETPTPEVADRRRGRDLPERLM